jgi:hypothetical protein
MLTKFTKWRTKVPNFDGLNQFLSRFHHLTHRKLSKVVEEVNPDLARTQPGPDPTPGSYLRRPRWKMGMEA